MNCKTSLYLTPATIYVEQLTTFLKVSVSPLARDCTLCNDESRAYLSIGLWISSNSLGLYDPYPVASTYVINKMKTIFCILY